MLGYIIRRIVFGAAVLLGTSIITFMLAFVVPGDPAIAMAGAKADPQTLSTIRREEMTAATSLYTVARRVGGNLGYALVATLVERYSIIHQAHLSTHINNLNSAYSSYYATLAARLLRQTGDPVAAQSKALALVDNLVNRQAAILAYNDLAWLFGIMFLATFPLLVFLPRRRRAQTARTATRH